MSHILIDLDVGDGLGSRGNATFISDNDGSLWFFQAPGTIYYIYRYTFLYGILLGVVRTTISFSVSLSRILYALYHRDTFKQIRMEFRSIWKSSNVPIAHTRARSRARSRFRVSVPVLVLVLVLVPCRVTCSLCLQFICYFKGNARSIMPILQKRRRRAFAKYKILFRKHFTVPIRDLIGNVILSNLLLRVNFLLAILLDGSFLLKFHNSYVYFSTIIYGL